MRAASTLALALLALSLGGCSRLAYHPKKIVAVPAKGGEYVGIAVVAIVDVACMPLTIPVGIIASSSASKDSEETAFATAVMAPGMIAMPLVWTLSTALGGPPWTLAGWWGLPEEAKKDFGSPRVFAPVGKTYRDYEEWKKFDDARKAEEEKRKAQPTSETPP